MKKNIKYLLIIPILIGMYFFVWNLILNSYSEKFEEKFNENQLKGKGMRDVVSLFGKPQKIEYETTWKNDRNFDFIESGYELILTYYTDNTVLNILTWSPLGGTRIFINQDGKVITFKEYND